jgi:drug/metabolite transporter superfamily protein YnfA
MTAALTITLAALLTLSAVGKLVDSGTGTALLSDLGSPEPIARRLIYLTAAVEQTLAIGLVITSQPVNLVSSAAATLVAITFLLFHIYRASRSTTAELGYCGCFGVFEPRFLNRHPTTVVLGFLGVSILVLFAQLLASSPSSGNRYFAYSISLLAIGVAWSTSKIINLRRQNQLVGNSVVDPPWRGTSSHLAVSRGIEQ